MHSITFRCASEFCSRTFHRQCNWRRDVVMSLVSWVQWKQYDANAALEKQQRLHVENTHAHTRRMIITRWFTVSHVQLRLTHYSSALFASTIQNRCKEELSSFATPQKQIEFVFRSWFRRFCQLNNMFRFVNDRTAEHNETTSRLSMNKQHNFVIFSSDKSAFRISFNSTANNTTNDRQVEIMWMAIIRNIRMNEYFAGDETTLDNRRRVCADCEPIIFGYFLKKIKQISAGASKTCVFLDNRNWENAAIDNETIFAIDFDLMKDYFGISFQFVSAPALRRVRSFISGFCSAKRKIENDSRHRCQSKTTTNSLNMEILPLLNFDSVAIKSEIFFAFSFLVYGKNRFAWAFLNEKHRKSSTLRKWNRNPFDVKLSMKTRDARRCFESNKIIQNYERETTRCTHGWHTRQNRNRRRKKNPEKMNCTCVSIDVLECSSAGCRHRCLRCCRSNSDGQIECSRM